MTYSFRKAAQPITMDSNNLKNIQLTIIKHLYRFRFLTSHQLSSLLNQTTRFTNYHLKVLTDKNLINKHYSRNLDAANQPAIYYLTTGSIKVLDGLEGVEKRALKRIPKERYRSRQFISRSIFIANFYLYLCNDSIKTKQKLYFFTKTELLAHSYLIHPLPDAYFARVDEDGNTKRYMVELIDDGSPRFALRRRIEQYNEYIDSEKFEAATGHDFPTLLFICPGFASFIYLKKHLERIYEETSFDQIQIYLATTENALQGKWEQVTAEAEEAA